MESTSCLQRIREIYSELKGAEKRVAEYILLNPNDIIHFSITELADECKSGEATIFRLCRKLGYKGYQELKIKIASEVVKPIEDIHEEINEGDDTLIIMQKVFNSTVFSLNQTLKINDSENIRKAVDYISKSGKVAFFGMGGSAALAFDAYHKFIRAIRNCEYQSDTHFQAMSASLYKEGDCIVAFSNTGSNKELIENLTIAKKNGVKIISITSNNKSPISKVSDIVLTSYGKQQKYKSEATESRISTLCLLDCLFVGVCLRNQEIYFDNLTKIRGAIAKKRY